MLLKLFLFLHIISSIMLVGGIFARQIVRGYAKRLPDVNAIAELYKAAGRIETVMIAHSHSSLCSSVRSMQR